MVKFTGCQTWRIQWVRRQFELQFIFFAIVFVELWHGECSWWKSTFVSFIWVRFSRFPPSHAPVGPPNSWVSFVFVQTCLKSPLLYQLSQNSRVWITFKSQALASTGFSPLQICDKSAHEIIFKITTIASLKPLWFVN